MAYSDPQTVTISAVAQTLARTAQDPSGVFLSADGNYKLTSSHSYGKRTRRVIRLDVSKIAADPLISAQNIKYSMGLYTVFDLPPTGFTVAEALAIYNGFSTWQTASSSAKISQLLGGEK